MNTARHRPGRVFLLTTHDLKEGFALGTRLLVFNKVRLDSQAPGAFGATITYDIPLHDTTLVLLREMDVAQDRAERLRKACRPIPYP